MDEQGNNQILLKPILQALFVQMCMRLFSIRGFNKGCGTQVDFHVRYNVQHVELVDYKKIEGIKIVHDDVDHIGHR